MGKRFACFVFCKQCLNVRHASALSSSAKNLPFHLSIPFSFKACQNACPREWSASVNQDKPDSYRVGKLVFWLTNIFFVHLRRPKIIFASKILSFPPSSCSPDQSFPGTTNFMASFETSGWNGKWERQLNLAFSDLSGLLLEAEALKQLCLDKDLEIEAQLRLIELIASQISPSGWDLSTSTKLSVRS